MKFLVGQDVWEKFVIMKSVRFLIFSDGNGNTVRSSFGLEVKSALIFVK
ncbi:hypothetical protein [Bacillus cereus]|nr:hypothetical protein [Bacillus cereus]